MSIDYVQMPVQGTHPSWKISAFFLLLADMLSFFLQLTNKYVLSFFTDINSLFTITKSKYKNPSPSMILPHHHINTLS